MAQQGDNTNQASGKDFLVSPPSISLPKGGGAIKGIGEKFTANPVTGTGNMSVPISVSPGRAGFGPQLVLSYDSGAGNGPFGLGWNLGIPSIMRKTDKGLPRYLDQDESDVFILAGAEDLVPQLDNAGKPLTQPDVSAFGQRYKIDRYRPRIEGLFALIERWTNIENPEEVSWRTISRDNITTWYGRDTDSRICDPEHPTHIYQWLISHTHDDKGNVTVYTYVKENKQGINTTDVWEANRLDNSRTVNRYLKRIKYGNVKPYMPVLSQGVDVKDQLPTQWMFEVVFDYGDHSKESPTPTESNPWPVRPDPFSNHRPGFELRTYRLCHSVLMFHHFPNEPEVGANCLVKATEFKYTQTQSPDNPDQFGYTVLQSVSHRSYQRKPGNSTEYESRQFPPVGFTYSKAKINRILQTIVPDQLENLPVGTQGSGYQWIDLDGEGLSGVLSEHLGALYYKPNEGNGQFGSMRLVSRQPAMMAAGRHQFMDLAGNGEIDVVNFSGPTPGFHERDQIEGWKRHVPFVSLPNIDWNDPNLRFVDLTGDGHADALITEQDVFTWYPSLDERGFDAANRSYQSREEDAGPRLVFADGTQTIFLADMCGDGLTDLVRIRNGEVCYWPNLGYGRFDRKVTLGNSPRFDMPDLFDPQRIRLADIDGSGPIDIIYLGREGASLYFNRSGNALSDAMLVALPIATENLGAVQVADLLGTGTACLVWNSHLSADAANPVRYINLMDEGKPHLLTKVDNNLGATTDIEYTPSTYFYLQDKHAGQPWITRLSFPVHCVSKVTVSDKWRGTQFGSTYSYHHGYFDGIEREFRGFGRVEQVDTERYDSFSTNNIASPWVTGDHALYQPPVKTITWYHTGAALDRQRILSHFAEEYFPQRYAARLPKSTGTNSFFEKPLPEPELPANLTEKEWCEALRACKGMVLRQESYELDIEALSEETPRHLPVRIYSAATHNCNIQRLQAQGNNRHGVFLVTENEAITFHYELDLKGSGVLTPDPRIAHTLNLRHDEYGNAQQTIAIGYARWQPGDFTGLPQPDLIRAVQAEEHIAYSENHYTQDCILPLDHMGKPIRHYRLRLPCEARSYELKRIAKAGRYYQLAELRQYDLSDIYGHEAGATPPPQPVERKEYHEYADGSVTQKRIIEHARSLYFDDASDTVAPSTALPFGQHGPRGLKYEDYKLALTESLLDAILGEKLTADVHTILNTPAHSGYASLPAFAGQYWMRSGTAGFADDACDHFFLPEEYTDPFGNKTTLAYDDNYDLFIKSSTDALGNTSGIAIKPGTVKPCFDYRVLAPTEMVDANGNYSEMVFDVLGMPIAMAIKGKPKDDTRAEWEADSLNGFGFTQCNLPVSDIQRFCLDSVMNEQTARNWLGSATTRFVYHFGDKDNDWNKHMSGACSITREKHKDASNLQVSLECSDGGGNVLMKKVQAEPAPGQNILCWIVNGLTILNNKGKQVKQYEPAFSDRFGCELPQANGVSAIMHYDAAGRVIRTDMPDGIFSKVEFSPWHVETYDANDTVLESEWYQRRTNTAHPRYSEFNSNENQRAAQLSANHANTPAKVLLDSLGREVVSIAHNRTPDANGDWQDEKYLTFTKLDAEGKPLWVCEARGNLVMQYINPPKPNHTPIFDLANQDWRPAYDMPTNAVPCYDIAGNLLFQHSMDAGDKWTINDAAGKAMFTWDVYRAVDDTTSPVERRLYFTEYDALHRPTALKLKVNNNALTIVEKFSYQDAVNNPANNLNGQATHHYDASGLLQNIAMDFKGSVLEVHRQLVADKEASLIDWQGNLTAKLENETWVQITEYDALKRMTKHFNWHLGDGKRVAVYLPTYSERGTLKSEKLVIGASKNSSADGYFGGQSKEAIRDIRYDAKGQRQHLELGNGTITRYEYDPETYRLKQLRTTRPTYDPSFPKYRADLKDAKVFQQLSYIYDPVGNITEIYDEAYKPAYFQNAIIEPQNLYEYDALYRLIKATGREDGAAIGAPQQIEPAPHEHTFPVTAANALRKYTQTYQYDSVGNILVMTHAAGLNNAGGWTRKYQYAFDDSQQVASNRLWRTWQGSGGFNSTNANNKATYAYNSHGSMLNLADVPDDYKMQWDHRDMIANINLGSGYAHYQYDVGKKRTRKTITKNNANIIEERIYLGGLELYRRKENGVLEEEIETLHLFDGEHRLLMVDQILKTDNAKLNETNLYRYMLSNHLGSSNVELDENAEIISYEEYHPYGASAYRGGRNAEEVKLKRYRYTGMERDEESGLGYHTARYYFYVSTRWISVDPIGISSSLNLYLYVKNNPVCRTDTNGREDKSNSGITLSNSSIKINLLNPDDADTDSAKIWNVGSHKNIGTNSKGFEIPLQPIRGPNLISEHSIPGKSLYWSLASIFGEAYTDEVYDQMYNKMTTILVPKKLADIKTNAPTGDNYFTGLFRDQFKAGEAVDYTKLIPFTVKNFYESADKAGVTLTESIENRFERQLTTQGKQFFGELLKGAAMVETEGSEVAYLAPKFFRDNASYFSTSSMLTRTVFESLDQTKKFILNSGRTILGALIPGYEEIAALGGGSFFAGISFLTNPYVMGVMARNTVNFLSATGDSILNITSNVIKGIGSTPLIVIPDLQGQLDEMCRRSSMFSCTPEQRSRLGLDNT